MTARRPRSSTAATRCLGWRALRAHALVGPTDPRNAARLRRAGGLHIRCWRDALELYFPAPTPRPPSPRKATLGFAHRVFPRGRSDKWPSRLIVVRRRCWRRVLRGEYGRGSPRREDSQRWTDAAFDEAPTVAWRPRQKDSRAVPVALCASAGSSWDEFLNPKSEIQVENSKFEIRNSFSLREGPPLHDPRWCRKSPVRASVAGRKGFADRQSRDASTRRELVGCRGSGTGSTR